MKLPRARSVTLAACGLAALVGAAHLSRHPALQGDVRVAPPTSERVMKVKAQALFLKFVSDTDRAGQPVDDEAIDRFRGMLLALRT